MRRARCAKAPSFTDPTVVVVIASMNRGSMKRAGTVLASLMLAIVAAGGSGKIH